MIATSSLNETLLNYTRAVLIQIHLRDKML